MVVQSAFIFYKLIMRSISFINYYLLAVYYYLLYLIIEPLAEIKENKELKKRKKLLKSC